MANAQVAEALFKAHTERATGWVTCVAHGRESRLAFQDGDLVDLELQFGFQAPLQALLASNQVSASQLDALWARGEAGSSDAETLGELGITSAQEWRERALASVRTVLKQADSVRFEQGDVDARDRLSGAQVVRVAFEALGPGAAEAPYFRLQALEGVEAWGLSHDEREFLNGFEAFRSAAELPPERRMLLELLTRTGAVESVPATTWRAREAERVRQEEAAEQARREEEARVLREEAARRRREEEERLRLEEEERLRLEAEERARREEEARLQREEEERVRLEEARVRREEEERARVEEAARLQAEEAARLAREEAERLRLAEEERARVEEAARLQAEEAARLEREEAERLRLVEEERVRLEEEARLQREEEARLRREEEARLEREEAERARLEAEARARREEEERARVEAEARAQREDEERLRLEAEEAARQAEAERLRLEEEARLAEVERLRLEEEARLAEAERARVAQETRLRLEEEERERLAEAERVRLEAEAQAAEQARLERLEEARLAEAARLQAEEEERVRLAEAERVKREAEEKERARLAELERLWLEEEARQAEFARLQRLEEARLAEEARVRAEEEERLRREEEARAAEERAQAEAAERARLAEEAEQARVAEEERARAEAEAKLRAEEEARVAEEARLAEEERARLEEEQRAREAEEERQRAALEEKARLAEEERGRLEEEAEAQAREAEAARLAEEAQRGEAMRVAQERAREEVQRAEEERHRRWAEESKRAEEDRQQLEAEEAAQQEAENERQRARRETDERRARLVAEQTRIVDEVPAAPEGQDVDPLLAETWIEANVEPEDTSREGEEARLANSRRQTEESVQRSLEERTRREEESTRLEAEEASWKRQEDELLRRAQQARDRAGTPAPVPMNQALGNNNPKDAELAARHRQQQDLLRQMNEALKQSVAPPAPAPSPMSPVRMPQKPMVFGGKGQAQANEEGDLWRLVEPASTSEAAPGVNSFEEALRRVDSSLEELIGQPVKQGDEPIIEAELVSSDSQQIEISASSPSAADLANPTDPADDAKLRRQRLLKRAMENLNTMGASPSGFGSSPSSQGSSPSGVQSALAGVVSSSLTPAPATAAELQLAVQIDLRFEQLRKRDHFATLGVTRQNTKEQIKAVFLGLAKTFHPDRLPPSLPHFASKMSAVFESIREAYETLHDDAKRTAYLATQAQASPQGQNAAALSQASDLMKMAEVYFKKRDYKQAEETFAKAHALDKGASSLAAQAWCVYMDPLRKAEAPNAKALMQKALGIDQSCDRAHYQLGVIARVEGDMERAERHFREAVRVNPRHLEANQELRLIDMRKKKAGEGASKKGGGFFR